MKTALKNVSAIVLSFIAVVFAVFSPFSPDLGKQAHWVISILIIATSFWVFEPFGLSMGATSCLMMGLLLLLGIPSSSVFSGFTQTSVWTMIPALFFGYALKKTGLGKKIVYLVLRHIKKASLFMSIIAWTVIGIILSLLTPSITVRVIIVVPLALEFVEMCSMKKGSKERSLVLLVAWSMAMIPSIGWYSGSLLGPIITGIFNSVPNIPVISSSEWLKISFLPSLFVSALTLIGSFFVLKPENKSEVVDNLKLNYETKISKEEKKTLIILIASFVFLSTEKIHGISSTTICLLGLVALCATGIISGKELSVGISWDLILFVGGSMCFGSVFATCGLSDWLSKAILPLLKSFEGNGWLLVIITMIFLFVWRFVDIALLTPTVVILSSVLPTIYEVCGIHPFVWIPVFAFAICSFFLPYQNMFLAIGEKSFTDNSGWNPDCRIKFATVYAIACVVVVSIMVQYWASIGYLS